MLIAEHSMCQPGRPLPNGASHCAQPGSSLFSFHSTKSRAFSLSYLSVSTRAPAWMPATSSRDEPPVVRERGDPEVDAALGVVGVPALAQPPDQLDHLGNVVGRARHHLGPLHPQRRHVLLEGLDVRGGEGAQVLAGLPRLLDDPVVDVRDVHDLAHAVAEVPQRAPQHVDGHERAEVADVGAVVDRGTAGVEAHLGRRQRRSGSTFPVRVLNSLSSMVMSLSRSGPSGRRVQPAAPVQASTARHSACSGPLRSGRRVRRQRRRDPHVGELLARARRGPP